MNRASQTRRINQYSRQSNKSEKLKIKNKKKKKSNTMIIMVQHYDLHQSYKRSILLVFPKEYKETLLQKSLYFSHHSFFTVMEYARQSPFHGTFKIHNNYIFCLWFQQLRITTSSVDNQIYEYNITNVKKEPKFYQFERSQFKLFYPCRG